MPKMDPKRGEYIARSFVCPAGILEDCEESFVLRTRANAGKFDPRCVVDQSSFEKALRQAIKASLAQTPRNRRG
jgi:hypothetical protein